MVRDESGGVACMIGPNMDITDRKQAEERLRLQVSALNAARDAIVIADTRGTIQWVKGPGSAAGRATGMNAVDWDAWPC